MVHFDGPWLAQFLFFVKTWAFDSSTHVTIVAVIGRPTLMSDGIRLYFCFVLFCHLLFVLFCVLFYYLMHTSVCISSSEALASLSSSLQTLIEINSFDLIVTKTYPRLRRFNR